MEDDSKLEDEFEDYVIQDMAEESAEPDQWFLIVQGFYG